MDLQERIVNSVQHDTNGGCWLWSRHVRKNGYASLTISKKTALAHRASYEAFVGTIPDGLAIDHKCKIRCCVNPAHLEPVSYAENNRRSPRVVPLKKTCVNGHPLEGANLYKSEWRRCAECSRIQALASYHRNKTLKRKK